MTVFTFIVGILSFPALRLSTFTVQAMNGIPFAMVMMMINIFCIMLNYAEKSRRGLKTASTVLNALSLVINGFIAMIFIADHFVEYTIYLCLIAVLFIIMLLIIWSYGKQQPSANAGENGNHILHDAVEQADALKKWKELYDEGVISEEIFNKKKEEILNGIIK